MTFEEVLGQTSDAAEAARVLVIWLAYVDRDAAIDASIAHLMKLGLSEDVAERELTAELAIIAARIAMRPRPRLRPLHRRR